jgi:RNA polymerase sigma-70 factor (ECF subfamily)
MNTAGSSSGNPSRSQLEQLFEEQYRALNPLLFVYLCRLTYAFGLPRDLAEEIVAQSWLRAWESRASYDPAIGSFRTWIQVIAYRLLLDHCRRCRRHSQVSQDVPGREPFPDEEAERREMLARCRAVVEQFSPRDRQVWDLTEKGMKQSEVAEVLGLPSGTVGSIRYRIHQAMRAALEH